MGWWLSERIKKFNVSSGRMKECDPMSAGFSTWIRINYITSRFVSENIISARDVIGRKNAKKFDSGILKTLSQFPFNFEFVHCIHSLSITFLN